MSLSVLKLFKLSIFAIKRQMKRWIINPAGPHLSLEGKMSNYDNSRSMCE